MPFGCTYFVYFLLHNRTEFDYTATRGILVLIDQASPFLEYNAFLWRALNLHVIDNTASINPPTVSITVILIIILPA